MLYRILCVGKVKDAFFRDEIEELTKQIHKTGNRLEMIELPDLKIPDHLKSDKKAIGLRCISFISAGITPSG